MSMIKNDQAVKDELTLPDLRGSRPPQRFFEHNFVKKYDICMKFSVNLA